MGTLKIFVDKLVSETRRVLGLSENNIKRQVNFCCGEFAVSIIIDPQDCFVTGDKELLRASIRLNENNELEVQYMDFPFVGYNPEVDNFISLEEAEKVYIEMLNSERTKITLENLK